MPIVDLGVECFRGKWVYQSRSRYPDFEELDLFFFFFLISTGSDFDFQSLESMEFVATVPTRVWVDKRTKILIY